MLGSGFKTLFAWHGSQSADPAVVVVHGAGGKGLRLMHFEVMSGGKQMVFDTKILHDGSSSAVHGSGGVGEQHGNDEVDAGPSAAAATVYDEIYTSAPGADAWNASGVARAPLL